MVVYVYGLLLKITNKKFEKFAKKNCLKKLYHIGSTWTCYKKVFRYSRKLKKRT